jgi:hypothetical protein
MQRVVPLLLLVASCALAQRNEPAPVDAPYNKLFDPWHACMAAEELAKQGAPDALRTIFLAVYVRVNQPFVGGEGDMTMVMIVQQVLAAIGDRRFSAALAKQRPEVRGAVASFCGFTQSQLKPFPRTGKLLRDAPRIDWPIDQAYRNDR